MKIKVYKIPRKEFEKDMGKYAYGVSAYENGTPVIGIKDSIKSKRFIKGTIQHEVGHIFSEKRHITRKLPAAEKRRLIAEFREHEPFKKRKAYSSQEIMQETIADLYGWSTEPKHHFTRRMKRDFPETMKVIREERKKFKPKLIRRKYD